MRHVCYATLGLALAGCLGPPEEEIPLSRFVGPAGTEIDDAQVQDIVSARPEGFDPSQLTTDIAYLRGFADGAQVRYWNANGANSELIAPVYLIEDANGDPVGKPIIDVVPGQAGYTPWWRIYVSRTTEAYAGEVIWSRDALDAAVQAGLVSAPAATVDVINAPVVAEGTTAPTREGAPLEAKPIWYDAQRAHWLRFPGVFQTEDAKVRRMPIFPVYILQRIDEAGALYEFATGVDIDGDGALDNSNNVFAAGPGGDRYSPLWAAYLVRVRADFPSIDDTSTATAVGIRSEVELLDPDNPAFQRYVLSEPTLIAPLVNCPIESEVYP